MNKGVFLLLLLVSTGVQAQEFDQERLDRSMQTLLGAIGRYYVFNEGNPIHKKEVEESRQALLSLLNKYPDMSRKQRDNRAMVLFGSLYNDVPMGMLEDAPDLHRQTFRSAALLSAIALCSEEGYDFYLSLAEYILTGDLDFADGFIVAHKWAVVCIYYYKKDYNGMRHTLEQLADMPEFARKEYFPLVGLARDLLDALPENGK